MNITGESMENKSPLQTRVVGVFDSRDGADRTTEQLVSRGISRSQIRISHAGQHSNAQRGDFASDSIAKELNIFFHSIFDDEDERRVREAYDKLEDHHLVVSVDEYEADHARKVDDFMRDTYASPGAKKSQD
ncbi:MAG: hypothetical protein LBM56_00395 [Burkholderiaceae bacterium]|jgi:hypothetical protein|nr:hypothetical protein [Burkholderiaceae bacterium]